MRHPFLFIYSVWLTLALTMAPMAFSLEALNNHTMGNITGQATVNPSPETRETAYPIETEIAPLKDTLQLLLPKPYLLPDTLDYAEYNAVFIDFIGTEANERLGIEATNFHGSAEVGAIHYTDEDSLVSVVLDGQFTGFFNVPSEFSDGHREHTIHVSASKLPAQLLADYKKGDSDFILSYQGAIYTAETITDETSTFTVRPNRQVQTVGVAGEKPLSILVPRGHGDETTWSVITTIPKGDTFVQIDVNRMTTHHTMKYAIKIANNEQGLNAGDIGSKHTDSSGTLGTLYMGGNGKVTVEPATLIITTFNDDV